MRALVLGLVLVIVGCGGVPRAIPQIPPTTVEGETFSGRIVSEGFGDFATPVAHARVRWMLDLRPARTAELALRTSSEGRTDADGRFALAQPPREDGYFSLWCETPSGWNLVSSALWFDENNQWYDGTEYLLQTRESLWRLYLVDEAGAPVAGATVELVLSDGGAPIGPMRPAAATDERGIAEFHGLEWDNYWADISEPGFAAVRMATHQFSDEVESTVHDRHTLPRGRNVLVRIRAAHRLPHGAAVRVEYDTDRGGSAWFLPVPSDGNFETVVPADWFSLEVVAPGYADAGIRGSRIGDVVLDIAPANSKRER